jgi:peptidyl-prolyl cis-trans isomerase-like 1
MILEINDTMEDVILETTMGTIVCEMYYDHAPRTCKNFVELVEVNCGLMLTKQAKRGYYNGVIVSPFPCSL